MSENDDPSLDLAGLGKVAKSIPKEVYLVTTKALIDTFNKLMAPFAETTSGFGRLIRQKFDNMVDAEKALAAYTIENALKKAELKAEQQGVQVISPVHPKSFINALEEASRETDANLHELWENLLADQLVNSQFHPHFVKILSHFSSVEAKILTTLLPFREVSHSGSKYLSFADDSFKHWVREHGDKDLKDWVLPCTLLCELGLADVMSPRSQAFEAEQRVTLLFKTKMGEAFLEAVTQ